MFSRSDPDLSGFDDFAPPFGKILFYLFSFVIMVILLNILIALYNSSYEDVSSNSTDEYMALFAQKTLNFIRAPDEHVFIAPLNLIEIIVLVLPFEWSTPKWVYQRLVTIVMAVIYAPLLLVTALIEQRDARTIIWNRRRGEADDDTIEEWEVLDYQPDDGEWAKKVKASSPDPAEDAKIDAVMDEVKGGNDVTIEEVTALKKEITRLRRMLVESPTLQLSTKEETEVNGKGKEVGDEEGADGYKSDADEEGTAEDVSKQVGDGDENDEQAK